MATSLDGAIASNSDETDSERKQAGITCEDDQNHLCNLISNADAIIVGARSIAASGGILDIKRRDGTYPYWIILSRSGVSEYSTFLEQSHIPRCVVLGRGASPPKARPGLTMLSSENLSTEDTVIRHLQSLNVSNVLLFGGGDVNRIFYNAGLVDSLILTVSPTILGQLSSVPLVTPPLAKPINLRLIASQPHGNLVFLSYDVVKS